MAKRKGGYRAPKDYVPRDGSAPKHRPGGAGSTRFGGAKRGERAAPESAGGNRSRGSRGSDAPQRGRDNALAGQHPRDERAGAGRASEKPERAQQRARDRDRSAPLRVGSVVERAPDRAGFDDVVPERLDATVTSAADAAGFTFADLGFGARIVETLASLGAETPFPIQVATIPDALAGRDVLGRARTGSGKTIAFGAAMVERLLTTRPKAERGKTRVEGRPPRGLILAPTRELALQLDRTVQPLARSLGMFTTQVYGGVPQQSQVGALRRGVDIVIGTPGRVEDLQRQGHLDLSKVEMTVLDEADLMSDLGFLESMQRVLRRVQPGGQKLLFSATLDAAVMRLVREFMVDPAVHEIAEADEADGDIAHRVLLVERDDRAAVLRQLAASGGRVLVFTRTKLAAETLAGQLDAAGVGAIALHGDLSQIRRSRNLELFTEGRVDVLVATDVAARGIHVDDVRLVIQADPPEAFKTYLHRAGRTGRAGSTGTVVTIVAPQRRGRMAALLERAGIDAPMIPAGPGGAELTEFETGVADDS